jgi:hypothetical protein
LAGAVLGPGRVVAEQAADAGGFVLVLAPQRRGLRLDRLASAFEVDPALLEVLHPCRPVGGLLGLLGLAGRAGEHALRADVHVGQLDPLAGEQKLADLVGVRHPARLEHVQDPVEFAVALHRLDSQPRVDERSDLLVRLCRRHLGVEAREQRRHPFGLQEVDLTRQHQGHVGSASHAHEV